MNTTETIEAVELEKKRHNSTRMESLARVAKLEVFYIYKCHNTLKKFHIYPKTISKHIIFLPNANYVAHNSKASKHSPTFHHSFFRSVF